MGRSYTRPPSCDHPTLGEAILLTPKGSHMLSPNRHAGISIKLQAPDPRRKAVSRIAEQQQRQSIPRVQPPLSPTERTVLSLLMRGLTERQVGNELDRSHNTVHVHVRNIYRKVGVTSRKMLYQVLNERPEILGATKRV